MEDIDVDIHQEHEQGDLPEGINEPEHIPIPLVTEERLDLLTADETIDVSTMGR